MMKRKYSINEHYFDEIDSCDKLRILGFLYADGYNNVPRNAVYVEVSHSRRKMLEEIVKCLESEHQLVDRVVAGKYRTVRLTVYSKLLSQRLNELGMTKAKSLTVKYPDWLSDTEAERAFISGVWDGDGIMSSGMRSGTTGEYQWITYGFCGNHSLIDQIRSVMLRDCGVNLHRYQEGKIIRAQSANTIDFPKFYSYIEPQGDFFDPVKMNKAKAALEKG